MELPNFMNIQEEVRLLIQFTDYSNNWRENLKKKRLTSTRDSCLSHPDITHWDSSAVPLLSFQGTFTIVSKRATVKDC